MRASALAFAALPFLLAGCSERPANFPVSGAYERSCLGQKRCQVIVQEGDLLRKPSATFQTIRADGEIDADCGPVPPTARLTSNDGGKTYGGVFDGTGGLSMTISRLNDREIDVAFKGNWCPANSGLSVGGTGPRLPDMSKEVLAERTYTWATIQPR